MTLSRFFPLGLAAFFCTGLSASGEPGAPLKPKAAHPAPSAVALPSPAARNVDFAKDIQPLFEASCLKCHGRGRDQGGFSIATRETFLKGGDSGPIVTPGKSAESLVVDLVAAVEAGDAMPKKGTRWTPEQVGLLRAWIDQGMPWPSGTSFARQPAQHLQPRAVALPAGDASHPLDRLLDAYFTEQKITAPAVVAGRVFARRAYLDLIGLLPTPEQLATFLADPAPDKRAQLVRRLLADKRGYADHWLTFWNDLLRNDYKGAGFIDGGRKQITGWLHDALVQNMPYDQFAAALVNPSPASEGFSRGIIWRGNVNASMAPPMQAAQNVSQVFLGVNLKCASCHDSFVSDWTLAEAYGVAAIYAEEPLQLMLCDKPTGKTAAMRFLYPELGALDAAKSKPERLERLAGIITGPENGRLSRTIVNRFWARLLGRGLVEPVDDMEKPAWNRDLLDWLAEDLVAHGYDLKRTLELICTSRAYQLPAVEMPGEKEAYVFRGPLTRRLSAEQFVDAISALTGEWKRLPGALEFDFRGSGLLGEVTMPKWIWTDESVEFGVHRGALRAANRQHEEALSRLGEAEKKLEAAVASGDRVASEEAQAFAEQAIAASRGVYDALQAAKSCYVPRLESDARQMASAKPLPAEPRIIPESERHRVVFCKKFTLAQVPTDAHAVLLASQRAEVQVNGQEAKPKMRDGFRNSRIVLLDLQPLLKAGENLIAINVSSHTEKQMNDSEKLQHPASLTHLNAQSGLAFYARLNGERTVEIVSDESWRAQRSPDAAWAANTFPDADWAAATVLTADVQPVDEGPSLPPITRLDFANLPVQLGPQLSPAVSTAAQPGKIRAALLAADPLQVALDRPNREIIIPARASAATTLQALELTNGDTLDARLKTAGTKFQELAAHAPSAWLDQLYLHALGRVPTTAEGEIARELLGTPATAESVGDLFWAVLNLPEFQLLD